MGRQEKSLENNLGELRKSLLLLPPFAPFVFACESHLWEIKVYELLSLIKFINFPTYTKQKINSTSNEHRQQSSSINFQFLTRLLPQ